MTEHAENLEVVELVIAETNKSFPVQESIKSALVRELKPIAGRLAKYAEDAKLSVSTQLDAENAAYILADIATDMKAVKECEVLSKITDGLHKLHRRWTSLRQEFLDPLEEARKTIKGKVIAWQQAEAEKAAKEEARLQAEADEKARREREKLEAQAAKLKTPEKIEAKLAQAAAVIAPTVRVVAPKTDVRIQAVWKLKSVNMTVFLQACIARTDLQGYIQINDTALERTKASNGLFEAPGVEFHRVSR
jgi:hypothetical protein